MLSLSLLSCTHRMHHPVVQDMAAIAARHALSMRSKFPGGAQHMWHHSGSPTPPTVKRAHRERAVAVNSAQLVASCQKLISQCRILPKVRSSADSSTEGEESEEDRLRRDFLAGKINGTKTQVDAYVLAFTCNVCKLRSARRVSKQAYHYGVVIIECPGCESRHLIADHQGWFKDNRTTLEDIMREKGEEVKKLGLFQLARDGDGV
eukprot:gnl/TRDRNA2_/TRDRNA2_40480_c0_seq2.p1 gnl/TRDRNA2_/TRDRNA2_40480_c0~~gnl/TRDRNA2_/TRDRNA2_40480_c0_seq2.p1  ORF type:complete len:206 (-),score=22.29 gnl/TRDRNA2_/TRDRNA2_40480_c0_seq2:487-1104(-)